MTEELKYVDVAKLRENPHNPRVITDDDAQKELVASIKEHGITTPLVLRALAKGGYEVLAGHRRLRAVKALKLKKVPAIIKDLDDAGAQAIMIVENLQREDIHPFDEATGFARLLDYYEKDVARVAQIVNRTREHVEKRLVLANMIPEAAKTFKAFARPSDNQLKIAVMIARLKPEDQKVINDQLVQWAKNGINTTPGHVSDWVDRNVLCSLKNVPWDAKDTALVPDAGPCVTCVHRTGVKKDLFRDIGDDNVCTFSKCFNRKMSAAIQKIVKEHEALGEKVVLASTLWSHPDKTVLANGTYAVIEKKVKACDTTVTIVLVDGEHPGTVQQACVERRCKDHFAGRGVETSTVEAAKEKKDAKSKKLLEEEARRLAVDRITEDVKFDGRLLKTILPKLFDRLWHEDRKRLLKWNGLIVKATGGAAEYDDMFRKAIKNEPEDLARLGRLLIQIALVSECYVSPHGGGNAETIETVLGFTDWKMKTLREAAVKTLADRKKSSPPGRKKAKAT